MADPSCPHKSESKKFYFKWWLCPDCYADLPGLLKLALKSMEASIAAAQAGLDRDTDT
tara:strand:- start:85 stop:258 length:174 start_codon:yes stop_codon:yes gene_type:complete